MMEHHKLCSTRPENDCGDGYEGICDCIEIYQARIKELESLRCDCLTCTKRMDDIEEEKQ